MLVHYICKVCGTPVATAQAENSFDPRLGLSLLTPDERATVLSFRGDSLTVNTYCDRCAKAHVPSSPNGRIH